VIGARLKQALEVFNSQGQIGAPVRVVDSEGNILDIVKVEWSGLNGGAIHIEIEAPDE
jgi:hypothetical protein